MHTYIQERDYYPHIYNMSISIHMSIYQLSIHLFLLLSLILISISLINFHCYAHM